jgi:hypothetical protein
MYKVEQIDKLIGKKILKLEVNKDGQHYLRLTLDTEKDFIYVIAYGDCCSETWFADILGPSLALNKQITAIEETYRDCDDGIKSYNVDDGRGRQDEDKAYGLTIHSLGGDLDIVYRNSSNGYYCGSIEMWWPTEEVSDDKYHYTETDNPDKLFAARRDGRDIPATEWQEIKEDWQAPGQG